MTLLLSAQDVAEGLTIPEAIEALQEAFEELALGQIEMPPRVHMNVKQNDGDVLVMPCHIPATGMMSVKVVNVFASNSAIGLPYIHGLVLVCDANNGSPQAVLDGSTLTSIRTAAGSGVATNALARTDAHVLTMFGAGVQARAHLEAMCAVRDIKEIRILDKHPEIAEQLAEEFNTNFKPIARMVEKPKDALDGTDIVCAATTAIRPIFMDADLPPGTHINAIGSFRPEVQELPEKTVLRSKIIVDLKDMALSEAGDLMIPIKRGLMTADDIHGTLGDVLLQRVPGRERDDEITLYKSVGLAMQDLAAAVRLVENCRKRGIGTEFDF